MRAVFCTSTICQRNRCYMVKHLRSVDTFFISSACRCRTTTMSLARVSVSGHRKSGQPMFFFFRYCYRTPSCAIDCLRVRQRFFAIEQAI